MSFLKNFALFNNSTLCKSRNLITVGFDFQYGVIKLLTDTNGQLVLEERPFLCEAYSDEFYKTLVDDVLNFAKAHSIDKIRLNAVFPETAAVTDCVEVPVIKGKNIHNTLEISLCGLYKNRKDLFIKSFCALKNKNVNTYFVSGVKAERIMKLKAACSSAKINVNACVLSSESTIKAFESVRKDSKKGYVFADVKRESTKLIFAYNGNAVCCATIPFGSSLLKRDRIINENEVFCHPAAEKAVLKAYVNALSNEIVYEKGLEGNTDKEGLYFDKVSKKIRRKETSAPMTEGGENIFSINLKTFVQWIYRYIDCNQKIVSVIKPSFIYLNIDREYEFVIDRINGAYNENISFCSAQLNNSDEKIFGNLSCYGGFLFEKDKGFNVF